MCCLFFKSKGIQFNSRINIKFLFLFSNTFDVMTCAENWQVERLAKEGSGWNLQGDDFQLDRNVMGQNQHFFSITPSTALEGYLSIVFRGSLSNPRSGFIFFVFTIPPFPVAGLKRLCHTCGWQVDDNLDCPMYHIIFTLSRYVFDDMCTSDLINCTLDNELSKLST